VIRNDEPWPSGIRTLGHRFQGAGYFTALIGKSHFNDGQTHGFDYRLDFNDWFQYLGPRTQLYVDEINAPNVGCGLPVVPELWEGDDPWRSQRSPGAKEAIVLGRASLLEGDDHFDDFIARETVRFLEQERPQPFFLVSSYLKPHAPFTPAPRFIDPDWERTTRVPDTYGKLDLNNVPEEIRRRAVRTPPELRNPRTIRQRLAMYYGCVAHLDHCIGQVTAAVERLGLSNDTIVIYTSDHGEMAGELGLWNKFVFYESSCRVPLVFRVPGKTRAGARCRVPVSQVALAATLCELCGLEEPPGLDAGSLAPLLNDPSPRAGAPVYSEFALHGRNPR
jgi:choline-sulfatase